MAPTPPPPLLERSCFFRPDPNRLAFHTMTFWQVGVGTRGPIPRKSQSPWHTPVTPSGQLLQQWVPPRHCQPPLPAVGTSSTSLSRAMPWLLSPAPSVPLDFSGASPIWATLSPALSSCTGDRPRLFSGKGWMLPYAPSQPFPPHSRTQAPATPGRLVSHHIQGGGDQPLSVF